MEQEEVSTEVKKSFYKKWWFWVVVVLVLSGVVLSYFVFNSSEVDADDQHFGTGSDDYDNGTVIGGDFNQTNSSHNQTNHNETDDGNSTAREPYDQENVYKTTQNYNDNIFVCMDDNQTMVTQYPGIGSGVMTGDELRTPTELHEGYLLDNKGIWLDCVFVNVTYQEYSEFEDQPGVDWFYERIIDYSPFEEFYVCEPGHQFSVDIINDLIDSGSLTDNCTQHL
jgi:outer membrane lipoprotein-sorting protein